MKKSNISKKYPIKFYPELYQFKERGITINLISKSSNINGLSVMKTIENKTIIADSLLGHKKEYELVIKTIHQIKIKPDFIIYVPFCLDRILEVLTKLNSELEKITSMKNVVSSKISQSRKILETVSRDEKNNLKKLLGRKRK